MPRPLKLIADIAQRTEVLGRKTNRIGQRDLTGIAATLGLSRNFLP